MLLSIRKKTHSWIAKTFIVVISLSLGLWGIQSFFFSPPDQVVIAQVGKVEITTAEYQRGLRNLVQLAQQQGLSPEGLLEDPDFQQQALDQWILRAINNEAARRNGYRASIAQVNRFITEQPAFQAEGRFNSALLFEVLQRNQRTLESYRNDLREELTLEHWLADLSQGHWLSDEAMYFFADQRFSARDFSVLRIDRQMLLGEQIPDDDALQDFFREHQVKYFDPSQYRIEYLELNVDDLLPQVVIEDTQLEAGYAAYREQVLARMSVDAAHILITDDSQPDAALRQQAEEIAARAAQGEDFAELAKTYSQDFATKDRGGTWGIITAGSLPPTVVNALENLEVNRTSPPVKSDSGYHIVKLLAPFIPQWESFAERRAFLETQIRQEGALELMLEKIDRLADASFLSSDLQSASAAVGLEIQDSGLIIRDSALFQDWGNIFLNDLEEEPEIGVNSEVLELEAEQRYLVYRVTEFIPQEQLTLEQARTQVIDDYRFFRADQQAAELAEQIAQQLRAGTVNASDDDPTLRGLLDAASQYHQWEVANGLSLDDLIDLNLTSEHSVLAFELRAPDVDGIPTIAVRQLLNGEYAVIVLYAVHRVQMDALPAEELDQLRAQQQRYAAYQTSLALQAAWRDRTQIDLREDWREVVNTHHFY